MIIHLLLISIFAFLSGIHFYWAFGGTWGVDSSFPTLDNSTKDIKPPFIATIIVGIGLCAMGLFYFLLLQSFQSPIFTNLAQYIQWIIPSIFAICAIGDFKYVGLFKSRKDSNFAKKDNQLFTPLCILIAILGGLSIYY